MHIDIIKATLAIATAGCLSLITVHAAERGDSSGAGTKHLSSIHRASTGGPRARKASSDQTKRTSNTRSHTTHRTSAGSGPSRHRQRSAINRNTSRSADDIQPTDANVQVELPRHENETENENEAENDETSILFGGETGNDGGPRP